MLSQYIRVVNSNNTVLTDYSLENQDTSTTLDFELVATEDYWYVGQRLPTNNFFLQVSTANASASTMSIQYWDQSTWRDALDVLDGTRTGSVSLAKSGVVQFSPDSRYLWAEAVDDNGGVYPDELSSLNITNVYWFRIKFSANIDAGTEVKRITYAFTTTQNVNSRHPKISNFYTAFGSGKTDWDDEIVKASENLVKDLKNNSVIRGKGQILELEDVTIAADWKTLETIYYGLGGDYDDRRKEAEKKYIDALRMEHVTLDKDKDARVSSEEINQVYGAVLKRD